jgi:hypothetical protein
VDAVAVAADHGRTSTPRGASSPTGGYGPSEASAAWKAGAV